MRFSCRQWYTVLYLLFLQNRFNIFTLDDKIKCSLSGVVKCWAWCLCPSYFWQCKVGLNKKTARQISCSFILRGRRKNMLQKQCESAERDSPWPGYSGLIMALFAIQWRDESILQGTENMGPMWKRQTILDIRPEWNPRLWQIGVCCTQEALCVTWTARPPSLANLPFEGNFMASLFHFNVILGVKSNAMFLCFSK